MSTTVAEKTLVFLRDEFQRFGHEFPNFNVDIYVAEFPRAIWETFVGRTMLQGHSTKWQLWDIVWNGKAAVRYHGDALGFSTFEDLAISADAALESLAQPRHLVGEGLDRWLNQLYFTGLCYPTPLLRLDASYDDYWDRDTKSSRDVDVYSFPCNAFTASAGLLELILNPDAAVLIDECLDKEALPIIASSVASKPPEPAPLSESVSSSPFVFYPESDDMWCIVFTSDDGRREAKRVHDKTNLRRCWNVLKARSPLVSMYEASGMRKDEAEPSFDPTYNEEGLVDIKRAIKRCDEEAEAARLVEHYDEVKTAENQKQQLLRFVRKNTTIRGKARSLGASNRRRVYNAMWNSWDRAITTCKDAGLPRFADHLKHWLTIDPDACRYCPPKELPWVFDAPSPDAG